MPIKYDKLIAMLEKKGITSYTLKSKYNNIIGQATFKKIKEGGDIDTRTIAKLCKLLNCQPGDILEYSDDETAPEDCKE
jgi:putative transcriptional regulator